MNPLIGALVLVLIGLLGARLSFSVKGAPLGPRLLISSGTHFPFFGMLLGPHGLGLLGPATLVQLYPLLALGIGWIGLLFGLQLDRRQLRQFPPRYLLIALGQAVVAFFVFFTLGALLLRATGTLPAPAVAALLATAATASVSAPAGVALIRDAFRVRGRVSRLLLFIASLDGLVGIVALQLAYALYHPNALAGSPAPFGGATWLVLSVALGVLFGIIFLWLTRPRPGTEELTLFLLGLVVFASGTALYLGLSPLFLTAVTGAVVANLSPLQRPVYTVLQAWEQPIYVILLILAGALLSFSSWVVLPLALGYLVIRGAAKLAGGYVAARLMPPPFRTPPLLGAGLVSQGGISLAMAICITLTYRTLRLDGIDLVELVFGAVVVGVVLSELIGPFLTHRVLQRAGEIRPPNAVLPPGGGGPRSGTTVPAASSGTGSTQNHL